jgi:NNP family nitrate/nitrite transporter-like MFS transporter
MHLRGFLNSGHTPSLLCAFGYFDISFMVWMLLAPLAVFMADDFGLDPNGKDAARIGFLLAIPLLGGAILRIVLGLLTDRIGPRRTGLLGLTVTLVPLLLGWLWADSYDKVLLVGLMLGVAGASFAAALPLASRWYPPHYQGLAMGIAGAGNSGTALATLLAPILARSLGWHAVFAYALIPVGLMLVLFALFAKDSPTQPEPKRLSAYAAVLAQRDTWWFCLFYAVTFGGFVGLASFFNTFFKVQYELSKVEAGYFATACVIAGSCLRPVGGYLADRFGGIRMLVLLYTGVGVVMLAVAGSPPLYAAAALLFLGMGLLGMGNGSVFQLLPQRFPREIGVQTGIIGAAGGLGGFVLQNALGSLKQLTGSYAGGYFLFALAGFTCAVTLHLVARGWEGVFVARGGVAATVSIPVTDPEMAPVEVPAPEPA